MPRAVLVGRSRELAQMASALDDAVGGRGSVLLLAGEPGIGKTRLAHELAELAAERDIAVRWGRCPDAEGVPPYWPWTELLRGDRLADALRPLVGEGEVAADQGARFRLFDAARAHLFELGAAVIVLDDLHWADPASLKLLEHVAPTVADSRLLLVGTYRDVEVSGDHPLRDTVAVVTRAANARRIEVGRLADDEIAQLALTIGGEELDDSQLMALTRRADGNPFFAGELIRVAASGRDADVPAGVREVVRRRIGSLGGRAEDVLTSAAVIGRDLTLDILDIVHAGAEEQLHAAARIGLVSEVDVGAWRFAHDLVRESLASELAPTERARRHDAIAGAIERCHRDDPAWTAALAHHRIASAPVVDDPAKVVQSALAAADQAASRYAHEDAAHLYDIAVKWMERLGSPDRATLYRALLAEGRARFATSDFDGSRAAFLRAAEVADGDGNAVAYAEALLAIGWERWEGAESAAPRDTIDRALALIGDDRPDLRARLLTRLAASSQLTARDSEALARRAVESARASDDPLALTKALGTWYFYWAPALSRDATQRVVEEIEAAGEHLGDREVRLDAPAARFRYLVGEGDLAGAERMLPLLATLAQQAGAPLTGSFAPSAPMLATMAGRLADAEQLTSELFASARTGYEQEFLLPVYFGQTAVIRWLQGRLEEMIPLIEGLPPAPDSDTIAAVLVLGKAEAGKARDASRLAAAITDATIESMFWAPFGVGFIGLVMLAVAASVANDQELAARLDPVLSQADGGLAVAGMPPLLCVGAVDTARAHIDWLLGRDDDADRRFAAAHQTVRQLPPFLAHNGLEWARLCAARGERDRARELAVAAHAMAHPLGMKPIAERAAELAARLGSAPLAARTSVGPAPSDPTVTLVFTDIVSSTESAARAGDHAWAETLRAHNRTVRSLVAEHGGHEVKTMGDGFMLAFSSARHAVECASAIQAAMANETVAVRIGVHTGETVREGDDFWGHHVNVAARIGALAGAREILVSDVVRAAISGTTSFTFSAGRSVSLKGVPEPVVVCSLESAAPGPPAE